MEERRTGTSQNKAKWQTCIQTYDEDWVKCSLCSILSTHVTYLQAQVRRWWNSSTPRAFWPASVAEFMRFLLKKLGWKELRNMLMSITTHTCMCPWIHMYMFKHAHTHTYRHRRIHTYAHLTHIQMPWWNPLPFILIKNLSKENIHQGRRNRT